MISTALASALGGLLTFAEIILSAVVGMYLLQNFKYAMSENIMSLYRGQITDRDFMRMNVGMALGALLLIVPGFMTDIIGVFLQFEFFARLIAKRFTKHDEKFENFNNYKKGEDDVIDVEIVDDKHTIDR